ncbi:MAG: zinc ribbon domain-containing protein [Clostridiaceae bacterium]
MAFYKEPCIHCGTLLSRDSHFCSKCGSRNPFVYSCPTCLREIHREETVCSGCGRPLYILCPKCLEKTFVQDTCDHCGESLLVQCKNIRCGSAQFFENIKCNACGKKLK